MNNTSKSSVVDDHEHDEGGVEDGEGDEELVEGVTHLLAREKKCIYNIYTIYYIQHKQYTPCQRGLPLRASFQQVPQLPQLASELPEVIFIKSKLIKVKFVRSKHIKVTLTYKNSLKLPHKIKFPKITFFNYYFQGF